MSPLRWDVLAVAFLLSLPVLALGMRGDLTLDEMTSRLPWCLLAGWAVVALLRWASTPRPEATQPADAEATEPDGAPIPR
jgi:hypothetical protein